ncbi:unnamed protein product, partial [Musa hybrid cultivar]
TLISIPSSVCASLALSFTNEFVEILALDLRRSSKCFRQSRKWGEFFHRRRWRWCHPSRHTQESSTAASSLKEVHDSFFWKLISNIFFHTA